LKYNCLKKGVIDIVTAADDVGIEELEVRAKVNGKALDPWNSYPYYAEYPIVVSVDCDYFRFDIRAKDSSGNYSAPISREFRAPFIDGAASELVPASGVVPFKPNAQIEDPPEVTVKDRTATLKFVKFSKPRKLVARSANQSSNLKQERRIAPRAKKDQTSITYQVVYKNLSEGAQLKKKTSKKNVIALSNLRPGNYASSYKAQLRKNYKVIASTKLSPPAQFQIK
jgi:hypothetical protein